MRQVLAVPSQLGPLLKGARKRARLSQEDLAKRMGISQSRMSHMELNPSSISLEQLLNLFGALGLELQVTARPEPSTSDGKHGAEAFDQQASLATAPAPGNKRNPGW